MNLFDGVRDKAYDVVTNTMGYTATWTPLDSSPIKTAKVLYSDPSVLQKLGVVEYNPDEHQMEYRQDNFEGLKQSVDESNQESVTLTINSVDVDFWIRKITKKHDGHTFFAILLLK